MDITPNGPAIRLLWPGLSRSRRLGVSADRGFWLPCCRRGHRPSWRLWALCSAGWPFLAAFGFAAATCARRCAMEAFLLGFGLVPVAWALPVGSVFDVVIFYSPFAVIARGHHESLRSGGNASKIWPNRKGGGPAMTICSRCLSFLPLMR